MSACSRVRNIIAEICEQDGHRSAAIDAYQESVADGDMMIGPSDPAMVQARERLIGLLLESGRTVEAVAELRKLIKSHLRGDLPTTSALRQMLAGLEAQLAAPVPSGPGEPDNWSERCDHADQLAAAGLIDSAMTEYHRIQTDQAAKVGADHPSVLAIRARFIGCPPDGCP